ncbi:hypothetical protein MBLNU230_g3711t2 [Neophaeotheca triangularis]
MAYLDNHWDPEAGYLFNLNEPAAMRHDTRTSSWYAIGLLARNQGHDVQDAERAISNVIHGQYKDPADQWYATYQKQPEEPRVGSPIYPAEMYSSWDPNWRGFVGTAFIIGLEEYSHLLSDELQGLMLESLYNATVGDSYRVGGVDGDNLYPAYTNPSLMRAFVSGWTGRRLGDSNMTRAGEHDANEVITLFNMTDALSEFNGPTYNGISLFALTLWDKYLPADSVMKQNGKRMAQKTYEAVGELWNPRMKNIAGPWDRSYGYDMNKYFAAMAGWLWVLVGKEKSSVYEKPELMSHASDFSLGPLMAILSRDQEAFVTPDVMEKLQYFQGEHTFEISAFSPPYDYALRNYTTWMSENISIGGVSFDQDVIGGTSLAPGSWSPAVIQWLDAQSSEIGYLVYYATESALDAKVSPMGLNLTYPRGNASSIFTLMLSPPTGNPTISGWEGAEGLSVTVTTYPEMEMNLTFAGMYGGASDPIQ